MLRRVLLAACVAALAARPAAAAQWSAGTFSATPEQNGLGVVAGVGFNSGAAIGVTWSGPFIGLEVRGGYQPTYELLRNCRTNWCILPTDVVIEDSAALSADLLLPLTCNRRACLGVEGGYRHSGFLKHGIGFGLYVQERPRGWLRFSAALGMTIYSGGAGYNPFFLGFAGHNDTGGTAAVGLEFALSFGPPRTSR